MLGRIFLFVVFSSLLPAQIDLGPAFRRASCTAAAPCVISSNFAADLAGVADMRPGTWGTQGAVRWPIRFWPAVGERVRVRRVQGDLVSWVRAPVHDWLKAGVLLALHSTAPEGSRRCDWCADNTFLYVQDALAGNGTRRAAFDRRLPDIWLEADHTLMVKAAVWLNDMGRPVHLEPTLTITYFFERTNE